MSNTDLIRSLYAAFAARDRGRLDAILHEDIEWRQMPGFPGGGVWIGRAVVYERVFEPFRAAWTGWRADVDEYLGAGDRVIAIGRYFGRFGATGKEIGDGGGAGFAHVYTIADGRVVRFEQFTDTAVVAEAMRAG